MSLKYHLKILWQVAWLYYFKLYCYYALNPVIIENADYLYTLCGLSYQSKVNHQLCFMCSCQTSSTCVLNFSIISLKKSCVKIVVYLPFLDFSKVLLIIEFYLFWIWAHPPDFLFFTDNRSRLPFSIEP